MTRAAPVRRSAPASAVPCCCGDLRGVAVLAAWLAQEVTQAASTRLRWYVAVIRGVLQGRFDQRRQFLAQLLINDVAASSEARVWRRRAPMLSRLSSRGPVLAPAGPLSVSTGRSSSPPPGGVLPAIVAGGLVGGRAKPGSCAAGAVRASRREDRRRPRPLRP
jgi:hypothetical protein